MRRVSFAPRAAVLVVLGLLLAGCGGAASEGGAPGGPNPAVGAPSGRGEPPPVQAPRDLSSRVADPCATLLSERDLERLRYSTSGEFRVDVLGSPVCTWREGDSARRASVSVLAQRELLRETYRNITDMVFRPVSIAGFPAVNLTTREQSTACTTTVKVAETQSFTVDTSVRARPDGTTVGDSCEEANRVAEAVVATLPPG